MNELIPETSQYCHTTNIGQNRPKPEDVVEFVDLPSGFFPILFPNEIVPNKAIKLQNREQYAVYDVPVIRRNLGNHRWHVPVDQIKLWRAEFLLQRDSFYRDLVLGDELGLFQHFSGRVIAAPKWQVEKFIIPHYFPNGIFIPTGDNPIAKAVRDNYQYADGTLEAIILV